MNDDTLQQHPLEDGKQILATGNLIPPGDGITANGLEMWQNSPPLYHDLTCMPYTKYDVQEWTGKIKKYKIEVVHYADLCRRLEREVAQLQDELENDTGKFEGLEERIQAETMRRDELRQLLQEETLRRNQNLAECVSLRRARQQILKQHRALRKEITETKSRTCLLKTDVERNKAKHQAALGEKEKLNLERRWFFNERLLLEETTIREIQDIATMKEKLEKLRFCMHKAWSDTKALDLLGHLRATKYPNYNDEWYSARKRTFTRKKASDGNPGGYTVESPDP